MFGRKQKIRKDQRPILGIDASRANSTTRTGTEWYSFHVIQELKKLVPDDAQVVLYSKEPLRDGLEDLPEHWKSCVLRWSPGRFWTQLRLSWEMLRRPPDVLFVPAHTLPIILPRRAVITVHDLGFLVVPQAYSWGERFYHRLTTWFAVRFASRLITVSDFSRQEIKDRLDVDEKRVTVTPLACDPEIFRSDYQESKIESVLTSYNVKRPYFLFTGRLEYKKNLGVLLSAFAEYVRGGGSADLVLIGKRGLGAEFAFAGIDEITRDRVLELGYVSTEALPLLYAGAQAFIFPSRYEGFGIPLLEAFSSGVPVITTSVASIPEVADGAALFVEVDDVVGLAAAMRRLDVEIGLRGSLIRAGLKRAADYSWHKTAKLTWEVLRSELQADGKVD
jgi:glycosyltransferase involved in cell wall biosynthesis